MTPAPTTLDAISETIQQLASLKPIGPFGSHRGKTGGQGAAEKLPEATKKRFQKHGIDVSEGYPHIPSHIPTFIDEAFAVRNEEVPYIERGREADPEKRALFAAAKEVKHLTKHIGTEIVGLQLADLSDRQKDELALLVAERVVVFFRDQDLSPQKQLELGDYWGQVEVHPQGPYVPIPGLEAGTPSGISIIWRKYWHETNGFPLEFRKIRSGWHADLVHEKQPSGITHLHNDAIPEVGGDTAWASGYAAYDKLSPAFQKFLDGKTAIYRSAHGYIDRENPLKGPVFIEREHPIIRTHPATGWKTLYVNRSHTVKIVGLEPEELKAVLEYLFGIFEKNLDIQVRFLYQPTKKGFGTSAIWDNRISQHVAITDYDSGEDRHGTRVTSLAEVPYFDPESKSQREALRLDSQ